MTSPDHDRAAAPSSNAPTGAGEGPAPGAEVERLRRALDEEQHRTLRLLADFDNFRRRMAREHEVARHDGQRAVLLPLLPVLDSLKRALAAGSIDPEFYEGVAATQRLFVTALREAGVDPGTVAREVRRGWRFGDEVLRPAHVVATARELGDPWR